MAGMFPSEGVLGGTDMGMWLQGWGLPQVVLSKCLLCPPT